MGSKMEACSECTKSCVSLHRKKTDPYPIVSSFFKVMFGKEVHEELIVPPKFAKTLAALKGNNMYLEDSTGQKWSVHLSNVKGNLVFRKGWREFFADHGIEMGDFLVFHYFTGSHFLVQIFTRSGCEKLATFGGKDYQNKRSKVVKEPEETNCDGDMAIVVAKDVPSQESARKRPKLAPAEELIVETSFLINGTTNYPGDDDRGHLFDLSAFEMPALKPDAVKTSIVQVNRDSEVVNSCQNTPSGISLLVEKGQIAKEKSPSVSNEACLSEKECDILPENIPDVDMPQMSDMPQEITIPNKDSAASESYQMTGGIMKLIKKETTSVQEVCVYILDNSPSVSRDNVTLSPGRNSMVNNGDADHVSPCKDLVINNGDPGSSRDNMELVEGVPKKPMKSEVVEFCDYSTTAAISITCSAQQINEPFLELPRNLSPRIFRNGAKANQKLVFLRDPARRLWPVVYHERQGLKTLTHGWKEFRKSNSIQMGDQCTFLVENVEDRIFNVEILRC